MKRLYCGTLLVFCCGLAPHTSEAQKSSAVSCDPDELYRCYSDTLEQVLPMDLYEFSDIVFRRYDTYARSHSPTEFVAALNLVFRDGRRVIEASHRRLLDENLYMQLSGNDSAQATVVRWSDGETSVDECPAIAEVWEKARQLELNRPSEIPPYDVSGSDEDESMVIRLHPRIYEVSFTVDDQAITVVQKGGPTALSDWVDESISVLESCSAGIRTTGAG